MDQRARGRSPPSRRGGIAGNAGDLPLRRVAVSPRSAGSVSEIPDSEYFLFQCFDGSIRVRKLGSGEDLVWVRSRFG